MKALLNEYRDRMGWNDQAIISILCDFILTNRPTAGLSIGEYLERRACHEEGCSAAAGESLTELLDALQDGRVELAGNLPRFGGESPVSRLGPPFVWSWDETHLLVGIHASDLKLVSREHHASDRRATPESAGSIARRFGRTPDPATNARGCKHGRRAAMRVGGKLRDVLPKDAKFVNKIGPNEKWTSADGKWLYLVEPRTKKVLNVAREVAVEHRGGSHYEESD